MILPSWATHLAIDEDGEVGVFDRMRVFVPPTSTWCGWWELPRATGWYALILRAPRLNAALYPVEVAERLCVSFEGILPPWTAHIAFDAEDGMVGAYDAKPVWKRELGIWAVASHMGRCDTLDHVGTLDASIARTLCFAISAPSTEEGDVWPTVQVG